MGSVNRLNTVLTVDAEGGSKEAMSVLNVFPQASEMARLAMW